MKTLSKKYHLRILVTLFATLLLILSIFNAKGQSLNKVRSINLSKVVDTSFYWNNFRILTILADSTHAETIRTNDTPRKKLKRAVTSMVIAYRNTHHIAPPNAWWNTNLELPTLG
ncbi:MAG: hypothetical protein WCQ95_10275 [Bacteroidota bacterium]